MAHCVLKHRLSMPRIDYVSLQITKLSQEILQKLQGKGLDLTTENDLFDFFIAIWTTTPWTIPANEAVAVNPKINYVFARDKNNKIYLFAKDLLTAISNKIEREFEVLLEIIIRNCLTSIISPSDNNTEEEEKEEKNDVHSVQ